MATIKVTYFKQSGKYYTEATYETGVPIAVTEGCKVLPMYDVVDEIKRFRDEKILPGVVNGREFFIVIDSDDGFPVLIHPA